MKQKLLNLSESISSTVSLFLTTKNLVFLVFISILSACLFLGFDYVLFSDSIGKKSLLVGLSLGISLYFCTLILSRDDFQKQVYELEEYNDECLKSLQEFEELSKQQAQKIEKIDNLLYRVHVEYEVPKSFLGLE